MKYHKPFVLTVCLLIFGAFNGYADRLYMWKDSQGVDHISKEPPPENAKRIDIMDYENPTAPPRQNQQTEQKQPKNLNVKYSGDDNQSTKAGDRSEGVADYEYDDRHSDRYTRRVRKEERREERQDNIEDRQADDDTRIKENMEETREDRRENREDIHDSNRPHEEPIRDNVEHRSDPHKK